MWLEGLKEGIHGKERAQHNSWNRIAVRNVTRDFPGGPVVKNPPYNARDADSIPGQGTKIPHAAGQLRPRAATAELVGLNDHVLQTTEPKCPGPASHNWRRENLHATTREKPAHHKERSRSPQ